MAKRHLWGWLILLSFLGTLVWGCLSIGRSPVIPISSSAERKEIRGVWLTNVGSDVLFDRARLENALTELKNFNFNTIYPVIWNGGYTLYPSQVMKNEVGIAVAPGARGLENRDLLDELVREGRARGLTVIPWFEFGFMAPRDSALAKNHPDWGTKKYDGSVVDSNASNQFGKEIVWLNPFRPEVQQLILDLVTEIVSRYEVDGIQFDDHFGLPIDFGYDEYTIDLYRRENNGKSPPAPKADGSHTRDPDWQRWQQWRIDKITEFLEKISRKVKEIRPKAILSMSPLEYPYARDKALVDWRNWAKNKLVDEIVIQMYFQDRAFDDRVRLDNPYHPELSESREKIAIGICATQCDPPRPAPSILEVKRQVEKTRDMNYAGVAFFFYETLWNRPSGSESIEERKKVFQELFPSPTQRPAL